MAVKRKTSVNSNRVVVGGGGLISKVLNTAIDLLPVEAHLPGYRFCGPGTKYRERVARGDKGINPLDEGCKGHDAVYNATSDPDVRQKADKELASKAWARVKASDSSLGERVAALAVTAAMKAKTAFGGGRKRGRKATHKKGKGLYLKPYPKRGGGVSKCNKKRKEASSGGGRAKKRCQSKKNPDKTFN